MSHRVGERWDAIIVGAGLAGSAAAFQLAEHGLRVLVLELGNRRPAPRIRRARRGVRRLVRGQVPHDADRWETALQLYDRVPPLAARPAMPRRIEAFLGHGPGGSSTIYGAALGRFRRSDFLGGSRPAAAGGDAGGEPPLPNAWPVPFELFRDYYRRAEALMGIVGERDPLDPDDDGAPGPPPPLSGRDTALRRLLERNGLHPYRLRVGMAYLPGCRECTDRRCPRGCKADGASRALNRALATGRVKLVTGAAVQSILPRADGFAVLARVRGRPVPHRGRFVVLAAGALNTPSVLARSSRLWPDGPPPLLGGGLMFHVSDLFAVRAPRGLAAVGPQKTLALRDFYGDGARGVGEIQSVGVTLKTGVVMGLLRARLRGILPDRLLGIAELMRPLAWLAAWGLGPMPVFATITEDLPFASNRVWEAPAGVISLTYAASAELAARARRMRAQIRAAFAPWRVVFLTSPATPNWGHPMGTCRMGADPASSVTDPDGRLWAQPGVYVADAAAFPASGGTGPSLTIVAHALRVADHLAAAAASGPPAACAGDDAPPG